MSELLKEYIKWVEDNGHLTRNSSSVLKAFIKEKGYHSTFAFEVLAKELGF